MTQNKSEHSIYSLEQCSDLKSLISSLNNEKARSALALTNRMFGLGECQDKRIIYKLAQYLSSGHIDMAVKLLNLRPDLIKNVKKLLEPVFFKLVGLAKQDEMEIILKSFPEFLCTYAPITDISGVLPVIDVENCMGITAFQHALWAGDVRYMCGMIMSCLPKNADGEILRIELLRQYHELMDHGVVYMVKDKIQREKQFNLQPLIDAFQYYLDNYNNLTEPARILFLCSTIGRLQNLLPAIVRHHYCMLDDNFGGTPDFQKEKLKRSLVVCNLKNDGCDELWDKSINDPEPEFAMCCGDFRTLAGTGEGEDGLYDSDGTECWRDIKSLTALSKVTLTIDLPELVERLNTPIKSPDETPANLQFK